MYNPMWHWIRDHHRQEILKTPFPLAWEKILQTNVAHYRRLDDSERGKLRELVQVFVAEKHWEGCGGLNLNDEIRVTIAAEACVMILALPHDLYRRVESIFIYPSTVVTPQHQPGVFESVRTPISTGVPILGEAQLRGPVILVWDSVRNSARHPETGHNVVYHEFAHKLDMLDGTADGTPPLENKDQYRRWIQVCEKEFLKLRSDSLNGRVSFLDSYGATNEAEFFAVITEQFFDQPAAMLKHHPDLYEILSGYYRQDPVQQDLNHSMVSSNADNK
jgi:Mlc titration factor MtfA (ptsG expression regulator)